MKPRYARALLEGRKTIEVRRRFPEVPAGTTVVLYASSPERAIVGTMTLANTARETPSRVWRLHRHAIDIDRDALAVYLDGAEASTLLYMSHPQPWEHPVPLSALREALGLEPPQSFRYLDEQQLSAMRHVAAMKATRASD
ncbi:hypothetical protein [Microbacterium sp. NPDC097977]|uniref:hypothetical protein n=1 Tax=Microbacterium sp. NPDC097977 TaxID=3155686 RepID=UPI003316D5B8